LLANYCFIPQPSTLVRRSAWESVGGLDETFEFAMDYELWWKLYMQFGKFDYCSTFVSANRMHSLTKTHNNVDLHYSESVTVVRKYYGRVPLKWKVMLPIMRFFRRAVSAFRGGSV